MPLVQEVGTTLPVQIQTDLKVIYYQTTFYHIEVCVLSDRSMRLSVVCGLLRYL